MLIIPIPHGLDLMQPAPFVIEGPAVVSFSGGRTSGYMLKRILDANSGLPPQCHVVFANTGKEHNATLDFVRDVSVHFQVDIKWVEYWRRHLPKHRSKEREAAAHKARKIAGRQYGLPLRGELGFRVVTYETAARQGQPFENLIDMVALPSVTMRLCSQELKVRPIKKYMQSFGYTHWDNIVGIRADEPLRITRMRNQTTNRWDNILPLAEAGVTKQDVLDFWAASSFDLQLPVDINGDTVAGNCDLCFMKSGPKRAALAKAEPDRLIWWMAQEARTGMTFRPHGSRYADLLTTTTQCDPDLGDCVCHD